MSTSTASASGPENPSEATVERYALSSLPTRHGTFQLAVYRHGVEEHMAAWVGDLTGDEVLCRVHSECWTGEVMGSLRCDCRAQLDNALERIAREGRGVLIYLRQEGRGIGLGDKVRAYALQDGGADTVDANVQLGLPVDARRYDVAAAILGDLGVTRVTLMTNNPDKIAGLQAAGVVVGHRVAHWVPSSLYSAHYLETKRARMGHLSVARDEHEPVLKSELVPWGAMAQSTAPAEVRRLTKARPPGHPEAAGQPRPAPAPAVPADGDERPAGQGCGHGRG